MIKNTITDAIIPDVPRVLSREQLSVYVPVADNVNKGIASYDDESFEVVDGKVYSKGNVLDVLELPIEDINSNKFYRLTSLVLVHNRTPVENSTCHYVDTLPTTGEPCIVGSLQAPTIKAYYQVSDKKLYGYVDLTLATVFGVPAGWYLAEQLFPAANYDYVGVITDIEDDPEDSKIRLLIHNSIYMYKDGWVELTNSELEKRLPAPSAKGHFAYTVQRREIGSGYEDSYELHLISHSINEAYEDGVLKYPYQIPLREKGIIKCDKPVANDDCANKKFVIDTVDDAKEDIKDDILNVLDKRLPLPDTPGFWVYGVDTLYVPEYKYYPVNSGLSTNATSKEIPLRYGGILKCATPKKGEDCSNKDYVDGLIKDFKVQISGVDEILASVAEGGAF